MGDTKITGIDADDVDLQLCRRLFKVIKFWIQTKTSFKFVQYFL